MVEKKKHPGGRPRKPVDYDLVEGLGFIHCTEAEVSILLGVDAGYRLEHDAEFSSRYKKGWEDGKKSLRRLQWEKAQGRETVLAYDEDGKILKDDKGRPVVLLPGSAPDTTMQIWLGKQLLGQTDKERHEITGLGGKPVEFIEVVRPAETTP